MDHSAGLSPCHAHAFAFLSVVYVLLASAGVVADELTPPKTVPETEVQRLIAQLDADSYSERMEASEQLAKLGHVAVPGLEEGVHSDSLEVSLRAFELLTKMRQEGSAETKVAATQAFQRLAKGEGSIARQAKQVLAPPLGTQEAERLGGIRIVPGGGIIRIGPAIGRAPIRVAAAAAVRKSVSISETDGVKTIDVDDNGKKIKIIDDKAKGISGSITETKDGKETTEKFAAKNAEELKVSFPEAHKLYREYAKQGGVKIEAFAIGGEGVAEARVAPAKTAKQSLEEQIKRFEDQIEKVKAEKDIPEEITKRRVESFERLVERLKESLKELEKEEK